MQDYLGKNIPKLGFGLMRPPMLGAEVDIEQLKRMVDLFMQKGYTYFDTAYGYLEGKSELAAREAIVERYPRESFQLATKLPAWAGPQTAQEAEKMFWTSLERTGAGYFDYYLLHNLSRGRVKAFDRYKIWDFLEKQKAEGRIKHLGFSMHDKADFLDELLTAHPEIEFVQLQINYADWDDGVVQSGKCHEVARKHGKPVIIMEPIKGGALAKLPEEAARILEAANPKASQASWAMRYAASLEGIITVLSGMSAFEQMEDNISFMQDFKPLSDAERQEIDKVCQVLAGIPQVPCTDCKYCIEGCPQAINIPGVFMAVNDYLVYNDRGRSSFTYGFETKGGGKSSDCIACGVCEAACPQSIAIIDELQKAAAVFEG